MLLMRRPRFGDKPILPGCVATVGVFDGLHRGHQRIIARVVEEAALRRLPALVFSFEPTPQEFMARGEPPARLMRLREKYAALAALGVDWLYCPPFDRAMESLSADQFIRELLAGALAVRHLVIGDDFRFGKGRAGTVGLLHETGPAHGFSVEQVGSISLAGRRVSSTAIRSALAAGELAVASALLGRDYRMSGRVVGGQRLGRQLGYPTANLKLGRRRSPVSGIFAVRIGGLGEELLPGVASCGTRPTVDGTEPVLEVHIFDFDQDIYGRHIHVDFVARLRDEVRFADLAALRRQMDLDAAAARRLLGVA